MIFEQKKHEDDYDAVLGGPGPAMKRKIRKTEIKNQHIKSKFSKI